MRFVRRRSGCPFGSLFVLRGRHGQSALADNLACRVVHPYVQLGAWDADARLFEEMPNRAIDIGADVIDAGFWVGNPKPKLQIQAIVVEAHEANDGARVVQNTRGALRGFQQHCHRVLWIVVVGNAHRKL